MNKKLELIIAGILGVSGIVGCDDSKPNASTIEFEYHKKQDEQRQNAEILQPETVAWYNAVGRKDIEDIRALRDAKISPTEASRYSEFYSGKEIVRLVQAKITSETAKKYDSNRFNAINILEFQKRNIMPDVANAYPEHVRGVSVEYLFNAGILPEAAHKYKFVQYGKANGRTSEVTFFDHQMIKLKQAGITPEQAALYCTVFHEYEGLTTTPSSEATEACLNFRTEGILAERVSKYDGQFGAHGIKILHLNGIEPEYANKFAKLNKEWGSRITSHDILFFKRQCIDYETIEKRTHELMIDKRIKGN